jgi:hypothetical protein
MAASPEIMTIYAKNIGIGDLLISPNIAIKK